MKLKWLFLGLLLLTATVIMYGSKQTLIMPTTTIWPINKGYDVMFSDNIMDNFNRSVGYVVGKNDVQPSDGNFMLNNKEYLSGSYKDFSLRNSNYTEDIWRTMKEVFQSVVQYGKENLMRTDINQTNAMMKKTALLVMPTFSPKWCNSNPPMENYLPCSYALFQSYFSQCNKFPEMGHWTNISVQSVDQAAKNMRLSATRVRHLPTGMNVSVQTMDMKATFKSPLCIMPQVDGELVHAAINNRNIKHIFMAGDSHGVRYFNALRRLLETEYHCDVLFQEVKANTHEYLEQQLGLNGLNPKALTNSHRGCNTCRTTLLNCTDKLNNTLRLEFIGIAFQTNPWLPNPKFCMNHSSDPNFSRFCRINSTLDLIYDYYLAERKPQVVITASTMCFDVTRFKSVDQMLKRYGQLKTLIEKLKPQSNMWFSSPYTRPMPPHNAKISVYNLGLYSLLHESLIQRKPVVIAGTNMFNMSYPIKDVIVQDQSHHHPVHYKEAINELLALWMTSDFT